MWYTVFYTLLITNIVNSAIPVAPPSGKNGRYSWNPYDSINVVRYHRSNTPPTKATIPQQLPATPQTSAMLTKAIEQLLNSSQAPLSELTGFLSRLYASTDPISPEMFSELQKI